MLLIYVDISKRTCFMCKTYVYDAHASLGLDDNTPNHSLLMFCRFESHVYNVASSQ